MSNLKSNIEGIYNYCDRWCERCKYTDRCLSFQRELKAGMDPLERDIPQEKSWNYIRKCFDDAMEMIQELAEREGIDLENLEEAEEETPSEKADRFEEDTKTAHAKYLKLSQDFFTQNSRFFEEKGRDSIRWVEMGLDDEEAALAQWQQVNDQVEVIQWYKYFIGAKLDRAASGIDEMDQEAGVSPVQSDANRTARILMVAIDRSIAAWRVLLSVFAEKEEAILKILAPLAQIRRKVEDVFPRWSEAGPDVEW